MAIARFAAILLALAAGSGYHVVKTIPVPGDGGWDYLTVDNAARRLYVSHGNGVDVLDADTGAGAGHILNTPGVHGIALAPEFGCGFISCGRSDTVKIVDLKTLEAVGEVAAGKKPDSIIYDAATRRVFVQNGGSNNSTVLDAASGKVVGTIELGGAPEFAVADGAGHVFVNLEDRSEIVKLDSKELKVLARWPLAPCTEPTGLAMDTSSRRLFAGCHNRLMAVVDAETGRLVTTLPIGEHVDATVFDAERKLVFDSNGDGTLSVFREESADRYAALETVATERGARTMALDPATHRLFLSTAELEPAAAGTRPRPKPGTFHILVVGDTAP